MPFQPVLHPASETGMTPTSYAYQHETGTNPGLQPAARNALVPSGNAPAGENGQKGAFQLVHGYGGIPTELRNAVKITYLSILTMQQGKEQPRFGVHLRCALTSPAQMWNRLRTAKRNRGESAEEWGDGIFRMCEALIYFEPRIEFEFFVYCIRNK
ncbi:hypothetical protein PHMEG_0002967 [Phytophthora megakarya]|uniref:Uncharacterized protein n=1 Tax=Phytophthora megakarya TaxID=4795 RepID=A0A225WXU7_9STRA|nr:hypothetical protein PHMEG_0002967 [Phytophthora megakarya]